MNPWPFARRSIPKGPAIAEPAAEVAADALAGNDVTLVVSSPMERAQQTSAPIAERHELAIDD